MRATILACFAAAFLPSVACQSAYYGTMEKLGIHKRDILVDRVEEARDAQQAAKETFASALVEFQTVVKVDGGELEATYSRLQKELDRSESRAEAVSERIHSVERVSEALFDEWENELDDYSSAELRRASEQQLETTRGNYDQLMVVMKRAEGKMEPVLAAFRDQVLFLKHNLNARAIASLKGELGALEDGIGVLIRDMETSIAEADAFISSMQSSS